MANEKRIIFDPYWLDLSNECLWKGDQAIKLRPKAFALLDYFLGRPGQLVTKDELLEAVWPGTYVGEGVLKVIIRELRDVLEDDPKSPRFIETAHRRGYRFIGQIAESVPAPARDPGGKPTPAGFNSRRGPDFSQRVVGRDEALARMSNWLEKMLEGERQVVFVTGEAGIGKTALVDTFVKSFAADRSIRIGRGQCLEQYGAGEAYLPVLDAIGRLCREQKAVADVLRAHAPMWLLQMPSLTTAADRESLGREVSGATRERMLREMGDALEVLSSDLPLVLILEDLHWSDYSTLDLISYVATKRHPARLMLIGTYRTVELIVSGHPLKAVKRELLAKQQCRELPLEYLSEDAVLGYLSGRFAGHQFPGELARLIHERTEGNPLFMVNLVDYLVAAKLIAQTDAGWLLVGRIEKVDVVVPDSIKQMIDKQVDHLDAREQRILEAASAVGAEFSTPVLAAVLEEDPSIVEARCDQLARQHQFIQDCGVQVSVDGEPVSRYTFIHALYRNVLYERLSAARRVELHRRIGEEVEALYGDRAREIAAELAAHFERARDYRRAAKYFRDAADKAIRRFAYREAVRLARNGLELLEKLPDDSSRTEQELRLQLTLGIPLTATQGFASPEAGRVYLRARHLCQQLSDSADFFEVLWGLWTFYTVRAELNTACEIAADLLRLAERLHEPHLTMRGHLALQISYLHLGNFVLAMDHFEKTLVLYEPERRRDDAFDYSPNSGVEMRCHAAWTLWFLGQPDQALRRIEEALNLAGKLSEPHGLVHAFYFAAILHHLRREERLAQERAESAIAVSNEHGLIMWHAFATIARGRALIEQGVHEEEAVHQIRQGLAAFEATGTEVARPHLLALLGEALGKAGKANEGCRVLDEALHLARQTGEGCYLSELYRIKGELLLSQAKPNATHVEDCFNQAIEIARQQQARSWELRSAMSIARLYQRQARRDEARNVLSDVYNRFSEGFDTADLRDAKALLLSMESGSAK